MCVQLESIEFYFAADRHCSHIVNIHIYKYTLAALMGASSHGRKKKRKKTHTHTITINRINVDECVVYADLIKLLDTN